MKNTLLILKFALIAAILIALFGCGHGRSMSRVLGSQGARSGAGPMDYDEGLGIRLTSDAAGQMVLFCLDDHGKPDASLNKYFAPRLESGGMTVAVDARNAVGLTHAFFDLKYDATRVSPASVDFGGFLGQPSQVVSMSLMRIAGHVPFGIARIGGAKGGVSGGGLVASVAFKPGAFTGGKGVSAAPGTADALTNLSRYVDTDTTATSFVFTEVNVGDYNADGEANIADLQPLATHYADLTTNNTETNLPPLPATWLYEDLKPIDRQIDGNDDGELGIADLQPLAANYMTSISGYNVYIGGIRVVNPINPTGPSVSRAAPTQEIERYQVMPIYRVIAPGATPASTIDVKPLSAGVTPVEGVDTTMGFIVTASALRGKPPLAVHLSVSDGFGGTSPYTFTWEYAGGATIATGASADVNFTNEGFYDLDLAISDSGGHSFKRHMPRIFVASAMPDPVTGLTGQRGTDTHSVSLSWTASTNPSIVGYNVYYSTVPGDLTPLRANSSPILPASTNYMVTGLENARKYFFWVAQEVLGAGNAHVESPLSTSAIVVTGNPAATAPSKPTGLSALAGDAQVYLSWNANPEPDVSHYDVYYSQTQNDPNPTYYNSTPQTNITVTGLANGTTYYFKIKAINTSLLASVFSDEVASTPSSTPQLPSKILNLVASQGAYPDKVALTWNADPYAITYRVLRGAASGGPYSDLGTVNAPTHNFDDTTAVADTHYFYVVHGENPFGNGPDSDEAEGWRVLLSELQPGKITGLTASTGSLLGVTLNWSPDAKATQYKLYRSANPADTNPGLVTTLSGTAFLDTPPDLLRDFYYWVAGTNSWGEGPKSDSATGSQGMAAPTGLVVSQGNFNNKVYMYWTAMSGVDGYKIYRSDTPGNPTPTEIGSVLASPNPYYNDLPALYGPPLSEVDYYYTIRGYNAYGSGDASTEVSGYRGAGPLNGGAWPKYLGDLKNTGYAAFPTPKNGLGFGPTVGAAADSNPVVDDQHKVYFGDNNGNLRRVDASGSVDWVAPTDGSAILGAAAIGNDYTAYVGTASGSLFAVKPDGAIKWTVALPGGPITGGVTIDNTGNLYVTCDAPGPGGMFKISPRGIPLVPFPVTQSASTPAIDASTGFIYAADKTGMVYCFTLNGAPVWQFPSGNPINGSVSISPDGTLVAFTNIAGALFALTSGNGLPAPGWVGPFNLGAAADATPTWGNIAGPGQVLYVGTNANGANVFVYCVAAMNGQQVWVNNIGMPPPPNFPSGSVKVPTPVSVNDCLYVKTINTFLLLSATNGQFIFNTTPSGGQNSSPALDSNLTLWWCDGAQLRSGTGLP